MTIITLCYLHINAYVSQIELSVVLLSYNMLTYLVHVKLVRYVPVYSWNLGL